MKNHQRANPPPFPPFSNILFVLNHHLPPLFHTNLPPPDMSAGPSTGLVVELSGDGLDVGSLVALGRDGSANISLSAKALASVSSSRKFLDKACKKKGTAIEGVNAGLGGEGDQKVALGKKDAMKAQVAWVEAALDEAALGQDGTEYADKEVVRMMLAIKINNMLTGGMGVKKALVESAAALFNSGLVPAVPLAGSESCKAAALLAPLLGLGYVLDFAAPEGSPKVDPVTPEILESAGLSVVKLATKDGVAMTSGTAFTTAYAVAAGATLASITVQGAIVSMLSWSALGGSVAPYTEGVHTGKPHLGQRRIADVLRTFALPESWHSEGYAGVVEANGGHDAAGGPRVDYLSDIPQVYGAAADAAKSALKTLAVEVNACSDSPMVIQESGAVVVTGNSNAVYPRAAAEALVSVIVPLVHSVSERVGALVSAYPDVAEVAKDKVVPTRGEADVAVAAYKMAVRARRGVAIEFASAVSALRSREGEPAEPLRVISGLLGGGDSSPCVDGAEDVLVGTGVAKAADPFLMRGPGQDPNSGNKTKGGKKGRRIPKIPKGTRDFGPLDMSVRRLVFSQIEDVYRAHGAVSIDTPTFEMRETLMGRYGEDTKLIYDLADQGGEDLSLRYDLTVPFARYVASSGISSIKRYHIGRVFRRDNPAIARGRFREFYQCDFDIAGTGYEPMVPDAECVLILSEILENLDIGDFKIKLNHRALLDGIFGICGVPEIKFRTTCSSVDKLDKMSWEDVATELIETKGIPEDVVGRLQKYVMLGDDVAPFVPTLEQLEAMPELLEHPLAAKALAEMRMFADYIEGCGIDANISFCTSLARGLDYYNGIIIEAVLMDETSTLGSIAGGGRYDELIGMFGSKPVPSVGFSVGIERVFALVKARMEAEGTAREIATQVFVVGLGSASPGDRIRLAKLFWDAGIPAEINYSKRTNFKVQLERTINSKIPVMAIIGDEELEKGTVQIKQIVESGGESVQTEVSREEVASFVQGLLE